MLVLLDVLLVCDPTFSAAASHTMLVMLAFQGGPPLPHGMPLYPVHPIILPGFAPPPHGGSWGGQQAGSSYPPHPPGYGHGSSGYPQPTPPADQAPLIPSARPSSQEEGELRPSPLELVEKAVAEQAKKQKQQVEVAAHPSRPAKAATPPPSAGGSTPASAGGEPGPGPDSSGPAAQPKPAQVTPSKAKPVAIRANRSMLGNLMLRPR
jgi:hypothetical protein